MPELMTVEDLAEYLRFTKKTIYKLLKQGRIPAIQIGKKWRFDKAILDEWLHHGMGKVRSRILVIDDDDLIRSLFKDTLEREGHGVETADTGAEGIEILKQQDYDLVFLDLKMPEMDGAELLRWIRNAKPKQPVIIITGYPGSEMMERAMKSGPFGVMDKPFGAADIIMTVNNFLHVTR